MNDTTLISAETGSKAPPAPGDVRAGLAGYAEWSGSPPVLTDAVELIDQQAQRIADLEAERYRADAQNDLLLAELRQVNTERDALLSKLAEIEEQEPVAHTPVAWVRYRSDGGISGPLLHQEIDVARRLCWTPLFAHRVPAQAVPVGWRPATEAPTDGGLYWVLIGDEPHVARFSNRTSTARWWCAYGIPRAVAEEPTHWMPIPDAPETAR